jgi:hypothetical protein
MPISSVSQIRDTQAQTYKSYAPGNDSSFADTLQKLQAKVSSRNAQLVALASDSENYGGSQHFQAKRIATPKQTVSHGPTDNRQYITVGQISAQTPTVSHILRTNRDFGENYWQIINSDENKNKPFTTMKEGDLLSINPKTKELFWEHPPAGEEKSRFTLIKNQLDRILPPASETVPLGVLDKTTPTISHVVMNNENIKGYHWDIIHAGINKGKPYSTLPQGTRVSIDPNTLELLFSKPQQHVEKSIPFFEKPKIAPASPKLSGTDILKIRLQELAQNNNKPVVLGTLSKSMPTISHVIQNNAHTQSFYKEIIYSATNRNKTYDNLQPGTKVCIDPVTLELSVEEPLSDGGRRVAPAPAGSEEACTGLSKGERLHQYVAGLKQDGDNLIKIGTLSKDLPTVSQLLNSDQRFTGYQWNIILADINHDKPFSRLSPGTEVSINPDNLELLFGDADHEKKMSRVEAPVYPEIAAPSRHVPSEQIPIEKRPPQETKISPAQPAPVVEKMEQKPAAPAPLAESQKREAQMTTSATTTKSSVYQPLRKGSDGLLFNDKLAFSAEQMIGMDSSKVDSYELLVRGLQSQGIQYEGEKGLKENLDQLAAMVRLDKTALQNVDGILQIAGETLYAKTLGVHATKEELTDCTNTMKQFLQKGLVVKLSTPSTNKSGIVSNLQDEWTLISSDKKTVNEATIDQTIKDLQSQASEKNEPLTVAVSRLKENVLRHIDVLVDMKKEKMSQASNLPKQSINTTSY